MPARVEVQEQVSLNALRYPLVDGTHVQSSRASQSTRREIAWHDFSGGIFLERIEGPEHLRRLSTTELFTAFPGHLFSELQSLERSTIGIGSDIIDEITEYNSIIHVAFGLFIKSYDNGANSWSSVLHTLPAAALDSINIVLAGTEYAIFATGGEFPDSGYSYSSNGTTYTDDTKDTAFMTFWDERLWGIDSTGQLWFATAIGTETDDAQLQLRGGLEVRSLFTGPDATGEDIIYLTTEEGLYAHDAANSRFVKTRVQFPRRDNSGQDALSWRGRIYIPVEMSVYEYDPRAGTLRNMGPDSDNGIPSAQRGVIDRLQAGHLWLFALVRNATSQDGIYIWNERGWHSLLQLENDLRTMYISGAYDAYRLWVSRVVVLGYSETILYIELPVSVTNPDQDSSLIYEDKGGFYNADFPWIAPARGQNASFTALKVHVEVRGTLDADQTMQLAYRTNYSTGAFTPHGTTITAAGVTTFDIPNSDTPTGVDFDALQLRLIMRMDNTTSTTSDVRSVVLEYLEKENARWRHTFDVDLSDRYGGRTPKQMRASLLLSAESGTPQEFTFRDDDGNTRNFYVDVKEVNGVEETGHSERGISKVVVEEL